MITEIKPEESIVVEQTNPYNDAITVLTKAFKYFNHTLITDELQTVPILVIMSRGRMKCYGWHWASKWSINGESRAEVNISAEELNRPIQDILATLIHEMAHMINAQKLLADCNKMQYHNKHFKTAAEQLGLKVSKMKMKGFAITHLDTKAQTAVDAFIAEHVDEVKVFEHFIRLTAKTVYKRTWNVPAHEADRNWFADKAAELGKSQKDFLAELVESYVVAESKNNSQECLESASPEVDIESKSDVEVFAN